LPDIVTPAGLFVGAKCVCARAKAMEAFVGTRILRDALSGYFSAPCVHYGLEPLSGRHLHADNGSWGTDLF
jgi:hypothetical protein